MPATETSGFSSAQVGDWLVRVLCLQADEAAHVRDAVAVLDFDGEELAALRNVPDKTLKRTLRGLDASGDDLESWTHAVLHYAKRWNANAKPASSAPSLMFHY
jgi:hypothetical protein